MLDGFLAELKVEQLAKALLRDTVGQSTFGETRAACASILRLGNEYMHVPEGAVSKYLYTCTRCCWYMVATNDPNGGVCLGCRADEEGEE